MSELSDRPLVTLTATELGVGGPPTRRFELVGVLPERPRLAIVGSRAAHRAVLRALGPVVAAAGARGWSLLSGGAIGIDGGVHRAALERGLAQLAVLPTGRDRPYPPNHAALFAALADSGQAGLLFAQPVGTQVTRGMFASRNAIVVDLADGLLVAEAGLRSGSRGTGELGLRRGLPVAAIAGTAGCGALIGAGARALPPAPRDDEPEALEQLAGAVGAWLDAIAGQDASEVGPAWPPALAWLERALSEAGPAGLSIDALPDPARAAVAICEAELLGLVCEAAPGRFVRLAGDR